MRLRIAATLLLMLQLQPLGGAALCLIPDTAPVSCHDMASHHRMTGAAVQAQPHCADIGMCVAPTPAVPAFATMPVP
ncbi:MAG TPA: hypothetical protein VLC11_00155, partial [Gemmatimonadales bacterium]|nr:hypothetical protein [Gemmatimonadales bacterium]